MWSPWPLQQPSVTTEDETLCLCRNSIGCCISQTKRRLPRCTTTSGSPLILTSGMKDAVFAYNHGPTRGVMQRLKSRRSAGQVSWGPRADMCAGQRAQARTLAHVPWSSPAFALSGCQGIRRRGIYLEGSPRVKHDNVAGTTRLPWQQWQSASPHSWTKHSAHPQAILAWLAASLGT